MDREGKGITVSPGPRVRHTEGGENAGKCGEIEGVSPAPLLWEVSMSLRSYNYVERVKTGSMYICHKFTNKSEEKAIN